jgi:hypothetical protein
MEAWLKSNEQVMKQGEFAAFIEDRIADIEMPDEALLGSITEAARRRRLRRQEPVGTARPSGALLGGTFASPAQLVELSRGLPSTRRRRLKTSGQPLDRRGALTYESTQPRRGRIAAEDPEPGADRDPALPGRRALPDRAPAPLPPGRQQGALVLPALSP